MVGRCADYALSEHPGAISVFIHADLDKRIDRISKNMNFPQHRQRTGSRKQISRGAVITTIIPARNGRRQQLSSLSGQRYPGHRRLCGNDPESD